MTLSRRRAFIFHLQKIAYASAYKDYSDIYSFTCVRNLVVGVYK